MPSVFDPDVQHGNVDTKIVAALERLSQAFRALLWEKAKQYALSPIQIQCLVFLRFHDDTLCRVGHLAQELDVTPPTISDAIATLEKKGLITKTRLLEDKRIQILQLTPAGERLTTELDTWANLMRDHLKPFSGADKRVVMDLLMALINALQKAGVITVTRMCVACRFFDRDRLPASEAPHYCKLLDQPLAAHDLRLDCPEHERPRYLEAV